MLYKAQYEGNGECRFIFEVKHPKNGQWECLDATWAFGTTGRLINHGKNFNLKAMAARGVESNKFIGHMLPQSGHQLNWK